MIVIIDSAIGNINSVSNMLSFMGYDSIISQSHEDIINAEKLIFPGVGSFDKGMKNLREFDLIDSLNEAVLEKAIPILGICLGMQLFCKGSEEGDIKGLGWLDAQSVKFNFDDDQSMKIPHMGWNTVNSVRESPLTNGIIEESKFYFVHSYHLKCEDDQIEIGTTNYGNDFTSVIHSKNIYGTQFHPEKSHKYGMALIKNFISI